MRSWFRAQASRELIIVTPNAGESWYVNSVAEPKAKYEDFVVKDLVEYVDRQYRTVASRDGRAVAGVSMGAWGAGLLGLKHRQLFGAIGRSPTSIASCRRSATLGSFGTDRS
jgi:S-formylglutathione hydrolase FrmB